MTPQQLSYYNQVISYLGTQRIGYQFSLDRAFYQLALPSIPISVGDKREIGKYFKQQVLSKAISVDFDYIYSTCPRCGYKDNQNRIHYKTV